MAPAALVTASSAGLGAATARTFATAGYRVVINYSNDSSRAASLLAELEKTSPLPRPELDSVSNFLSIKADLSNKTDVERLVSEAVAGAGRLDVVFSNGGWTSITDFSDLDDNVDEEMWDKCWNMNAYSVTKAAQIHLVKSLATMVGPKIRVNSVSPGLLLTDWGLKFSQEKLDASQAKTQLKRFATVEDVAEQVLCFARSKSVTGANAIIDAGWSL
ncbi:hypothetical protein BUE80_DR000282 [Diplocarpon rosae]|nr:hypothetical protein BUE80_DR000282 [Diplocarpon rosae]